MVILLILISGTHLSADIRMPEWIPSRSDHSEPERESSLSSPAAELFIAQIRSNDPLHLSLAVSGIEHLVLDQIVPPDDPAIQELLMNIISKAGLSTARNALAVMAMAETAARDQLLLVIEQHHDTVIAAEAAFHLQGIDIQRSGQEILVRRLRINRTIRQDNRLAYALLQLAHEEALRRDIIDSLIDELIHHVVSSFVYEVRRSALDILHLLEEK